VEQQWGQSWHKQMMRRLDQEGEHELEDLEEGEGGELVRSEGDTE